jgi:hypothetical protein
VITTTGRAWWPDSGVWKSLASHLVIPLFLAAGMALAYLGAFHQPTPHNLPVAVVGATPQSMVFAQTLNNTEATALDVRTVGSVASAEKLVRNGTVAAAYATTADSATIIEASAASPSSAEAAQKLFLPIAYSEHLPVTVRDIAPGGTHDPTGQGLFFLMVALTVGGYASVGSIAAVTARIGVAWRMGMAAIVSAIIAAIGTVVAGPIFGVVSENQWSVGLMAWLYVFGIVAIGVGLHPLLGKWTTPALTTLFVMLNITSSGGVFAAAFQPAVFSGLNTFWNGAAWLDAVQKLTYFPGQVFGFDGLKLGLWAAAGIILIVVTHLWSTRRVPLANDLRAVSVAEEEESVVAA